MHTRPPSADAVGGRTDREGAYHVRSVPVRIYLPDGPVLQDLVPPMLDDGKSSLIMYLSRETYCSYDIQVCRIPYTPT